MSKNKMTIAGMIGEVISVDWNVLPHAVAWLEAPEGCMLDLNGIANLREALDKAEAAYHKRTRNKLTGVDGYACEPSTQDRVFKTPACEAFDKTHEYSRHALRIEPYEVCPSIRGAWQIVPATHPAPSSEKAIVVESSGLWPPRNLPEGATQCATCGVISTGDTCPGIANGWHAPVKPRYPKLADWVRAQPEGSRLLAVIGFENMPAVDESDVAGKQLVWEYPSDALYFELATDHSYTAVWVSRIANDEWTSKIVRASVYREGEP